MTTRLGLEDGDTITMHGYHGFQPGDIIRFVSGSETRRRRLWIWIKVKIFRRKDPRLHRIIYIENHYL